MRKMLFLITLVLLTTITVEAQKHTESEYKEGYIRVDGLTSDSVYSRDILFDKTKEWASKNYQGVIYNPNKSTIHVETTEYLLAICFNCKEVGYVYFVFKDKGKYGELPFSGKKQNVISRLGEALNR